MAISCEVGVGFPDASTTRLLARNNTVIWAEINAIQQAILAAANPPCEAIDDGAGGCTIVTRGPQSCAIISGRTPMTWQAGVLDVTVNTPGTGYFPVIATVTFTGPDGSPGTAATADAVISASGVITDITITNAGTGYAPVPATVSVGSPGGGAVLDLVIDEETGAIVDVVVTSTGANYILSSPITVTHPNGTGAVLEIQSVGTNGEIQDVTVVAAGIDYQTIYAQVEINHPLGIGFDGLVQTTSGTITGVAVQAGGLFYQPLLHLIQILDDIDSNGAGASILSNVVAITGELLDPLVVLEPGANYSSGTTGVVIPVEYPDGVFIGSGGTVNVTVDANPFGTIPYDYYLALIGQLEDCGLKDQIEQVVAYFTGLGYVIQPQIDPDTGSTIRWEVCWC